MFIRRKPNKRGTFSVQVVDKIRGRYTLIKSFDASKSEKDIEHMEREAAEYINTYGGQTVIDFEERQRLEERQRTDKLFESITDIRQDGVRLILEQIYNGIESDAIPDETLKYLAIARIGQPKSKVAMVDYLKRYFDENVNLNRIYRYMDMLYNTQQCKR